jgi:hypothetical protein
MRSATSTAGSTCWNECSRRIASTRCGGPRPPAGDLPGRLVSRGPDSRGVVERVRGPGCPMDSSASRSGNHEDLLLRFPMPARSTRAATGSISAGSKPWPAMALPLPTARPRRRRHRRAVPRPCRRHAIPASHLEFFRSFAHQPPRRRLFSSSMAACGPACRSKQNPRDLIWIRKTFLNSMPTTAPWWCTDTASAASRRPAQPHRHRYRRLPQRRPDLPGAGRNGARFLQTGR